MQQEDVTYKELHLEQEGLELGGNITNPVDVPKASAQNGTPQADDIKKKPKKKKGKRETTSYWRLFQFADAFDILLMTIGCLGSVVNGLTLPVMLIIQSHLIDTFGSLQSDPASISSRISKVLSTTLLPLPSLSLSEAHSEFGNKYARHSSKLISCAVLEFFLNWAL